MITQMHKRFLPISRKLLFLALLILPLSACGAKGIDASGSDAAVSSSADDQNAADLLLMADDSALPQTAEQTSAFSEKNTVFTVAEAVEYMSLLPPAELGLPGDSMKSYLIYPEEGMVLVDGRSCTKIGVYELMPATQTNRVLGIYLLARDRSHLYRLDPATNTVQEIQASGLIKASAADPAQ